MEDNLDMLCSFLHVLNDVLGRLEWVVLGKLRCILFSRTFLFKVMYIGGFEVFFIFAIASMYFLLASLGCERKGGRILFGASAGILEKNVLCC